jgi:hypothetical protein
MSLIPDEKVPDGVDPLLAEYLKRMFRFAQVSDDVSAQHTVLTIAPEKPITGKLYYFGEAVAGTNIYREGFYWYDSTLQNWEYMGVGDFFFDVSAGLVNGHHAHNISSHNDDVSTTVKTVGAYGSGQQYVFPTGATIDYILSNNAGDTHEIQVWGLDANYDPFIQPVTLNGTTPVALTTPIKRVNFLVNETNSGTLGTIFLWDSPSGNGTEHTAGTPNDNGTVKAYINNSAVLSDEHHLSSVFTVPAGKTGYIVFGKATVTDTKALELAFWSQEAGKVPKIAHHIDIKNNNYDYFFKSPARIPEKTDVYVNAQIDIGTGEVSAHYDIILVDNPA